VAGHRPVFLTVTPTTGLASRHTDVSLWYIIAGTRQLPVVPDPREFTGGRWWTIPEIEAADRARFDPHLGRFLAKVRSVIR
jgi:8-oxo-dGTP diphosphatase